MIYTLTTNPSLDYILDVDEFVLGKTNRSQSEYLFAGGKGINVSIVLNNCKQATCALGFVSGFTGEEIVRQVQEMNILNDFIKLDASPSRINVKLHSSVETEVNAQGPLLDEHAMSRLYTKLDKLQSGDTLVLAGSKALGCDDMFYANIMKRLANKNIRIIVDSTKDLLSNTFNENPFLIKPNKDEIEDLLHITINSDDDLLSAAQTIQKMGVRNVLVSLGSKGAFLLDEDGQSYRANAPQGQLINSVGAGDSMVAGFLYGYSIKQDYADAFKYGVATGSASAFSTKLATLDEIENLIQQVTINK